MRRILVGLALATTLISSPTESYPRFEDGTHLFATCEGKTSLEAGYCIAYIIEVAEVLAEDSTVAGWRVCLPRTATEGQIRSVVVKYLRSYPEIRNKTAASLTAAALATAFPCH